MLTHDDKRVDLRKCTVYAAYTRSTTGSTAAASAAAVLRTCARVSRTCNTPEVTLLSQRLAPSPRAQPEDKVCLVIVNTHQARLYGV